ncbi:MAG: hypothetical protein FJ144_01635 [Deltaproteobacteria bacterium]|nr:hypothetical protein [Deltaproteobacteria bacterium]
MDPLEATAASHPPTARSSEPAALRRVVWFWVKVVLCLVLIDVALFDVGWFWRYEPPADSRDKYFLDLWGIARRLGSHPEGAPAAIAVGSSVVHMSASEKGIQLDMRSRGQPGSFYNLGVDGIDATGSGIMAHAASDLDPWLVVYGAALRDFAPEKDATSAVAAVFAEPGADIGPQARVKLEERLSAGVKRYWRLYRYRKFVREALLQEIDGLSASFPARAEAARAPMAPMALPRTTHPQRRFPAKFQKGEAFREWQGWYETRDFARYETYLRKAGKTLKVYKKQRALPWDLAASSELASLRRMMELHRGRGAQVVLVYFPENPVFRDPVASTYFDPARSDELAATLAGEADRYGARFIDLRRFLSPEDFYDMVHANNAGLRKLDAFWKRLIASEWQIHERTASSNAKSAGDAQ